jgi:hypothetical protein
MPDFGPIGPAGVGIGVFLFLCGIYWLWRWIRWDDSGHDSPSEGGRV